MASALHPYQATILCCVFGVVIFLYYQLSWKKSRSSVNTRKAPEPAGAWPLIGHLHMLAKPQQLHRTLGDLAETYGPISSIRLGLQKAIVVSNSDVFKECFTTSDKFLASRPIFAATKIIGYNSTTFALTPHGSFWREVRKIAVLELLSDRRLELLKHVRISEVNASIKELHRVWEKNCKNGEGTVLVDIQEWLNDVTLNIIVRMVAGKRYFGASADESKKEAKRLQKSITDFFYLLGMFVVSDVFPFLGWLDFQGHKKAMKKTARELDDILGRWLDEHKQNRLNCKTQVDGDFMDVLLSTLGNDNENFFGVEADTANKSTCLSAIAGGTDTSTITLTWAISLLLNNRDVLKKAQDKIDIHVGKDKQVEESDIEKLVYLQAIVKETLRLYPPGPLSAPHAAMEDCTVSGFHVPSGTIILTNIWKIQRDPNIWSEPSEFQPERFLTTEADVNVRGQHFKLVPFGFGRRQCPGISLAVQVIHLTLARLLQGFEFHPTSHAPVDMTEGPGIANPRATRLQVLVAPRLPSYFY